MEVLSLVVASGSGGSGDGTLLVGVHAGVHPVGVVRVVVAVVDGELEGRSWIAGDAFSMADIVALTVIDFASFIGVGAPDDCARLRGSHERAAARPSAAA